VRRGEQHQTAMLAVLMGLCLASAASGCCLGLTDRGLDPCDNQDQPAEAHPCLAGLKCLVWPWGHKEPAYSQFHPVPCSPAFTPRGELALGASPPGPMGPPPAAYPPESVPASQPLQSVPPVVVPEPEKVPTPMGSPPPARLPPAGGTNNQIPPQSGGTSNGGQATSATSWLFRLPARPVSAADQADDRTATGPDRTVR
jgi:hypothetical protein